MEDLFKFFNFLPEQASTFAPETDALFLFLVGVKTFFTILIFSLIFYFAMRYRRRSETERPKPIHGSIPLELTWSIIPLMLTMFIFAWGAVLFVKQFHIPKNALEVFVVGKQWMWKIQHPEGPREINELHVPINRPVKLLLTSEDVIHSFFIPAFRIKMDVLPGRYTRIWFEATEPGRYHLFCAEYCGTKHSQMIGTIVAMPEEEYQAWLTQRMEDNQISKGSANGFAREGERLFREMRCQSCHNPMSGALGPDLTGLFGGPVRLQNGRVINADEEYIRESILEPNAKIVEGYAPVMPTYAGQVEEDDILAIISYLKQEPIKSTEESEASNG